MELQKAFLFGITVAIAVGPIALLIVHRSVNSGFRSGALTGGGVAFANFLYGIVGFSMGSSLLSLIQQYAIYFRVLSSFLLLLIAMVLSIHALLDFRRRAVKDVRAPSRNAFLSGCLLTLSNPLSLAIYLGFIGQITIRHPYEILIVAGVCALGDLVVELAIAGTASLLKRLFTHPKTILMLNIASAAGIAYFGLSGVLQ
ncbi:MAG: LysE family transporter [Candidatus Peregrinibacteria bacterium]|nr:LysE family transporter [Candidatus Peregrinibacteria bacterium]